jgi:HTH-type transcriptional regulator, competence development regulator
MGDDFRRLKLVKRHVFNPISINSFFLEGKLTKFVPELSAGAYSPTSFYLKETFVVTNLDTAQHFGQTLRTLRTSADLSLRELARRIGVTPGYLSQVECGHLAPPTKERLQKIASVLGVSSHIFLQISGRLDPTILQYLVENPRCQELITTLRDARFDAEHLTSLITSIRENGPAAFTKEPLPSLTADQTTPKITPRQSIPGTIQRQNSSPFLQETLLFTQVKKRTRNTLLSFLLDKIAKNLSPKEKGLFDPEKSLAALLARERKAATIVGDGIALPHAQIAGLDRVYVAIAVLANKVSFDPTDHRKIRIVALILAPHCGANKHVQALVELAAMLNNKGIRQRLLETDQDHQILEILSRCCPGDAFLKPLSSCE